MPLPYSESGTVTIGGNSLILRQCFGITYDLSPDSGVFFARTDGGDLVTQANHVKRKLTVSATSFDGVPFLVEEGAEMSIGFENGPTLTIRVTDYSTKYEETTDTCNWSLSGREV